MNPTTAAPPACIAPGCDWPAFRRNAAGQPTCWEHRGPTWFCPSCGETATWSDLLGRSHCAGCSPDPGTVAKVRAVMEELGDLAGADETVQAQAALPGSWVGRIIRLQEELRRLERAEAGARDRWQRRQAEGRPADGKGLREYEQVERLWFAAKRSASETREALRIAEFRAEQAAVLLVAMVKRGERKVRPLVLQSIRWSPGEPGFAIEVEGTDRVLSGPA